ncbi:uncharacterized protein LOC132601987 [Lycium barbarum]|uniref:uncharacterized protein LOC132601987 n=1 Tax=Lycium barbarum TaxID=112863 RepID=UPI00293E9992|nr:uncharacterized protein LOC132601987 [Lycium barbarum]
MDTLAFVHGAFHWLGLSLKKSVASFSSSSEVYGEIALPEGMHLISDMDYNEHGVSVLGGVLCVYSTHAHHGKYPFKLWVMKDYGVKESWNQLFTIQGNDLYSITPKYRFSDGDVLLHCIHLIGAIFILSRNQLERNGSVFKTSKESSGLWPQSDLKSIQNGFV